MTVVDEVNIEKALRIANDWLSEVQYEAPYFDRIDVETIKQALEKQIPKKPIDRIMFKECPSCGEIEISYCNFCPKCGQALDWT